MVNVCSTSQKSRVTDYGWICETRQWWPSERWKFWNAQTERCVGLGSVPCCCSCATCRLTSLVCELPLIWVQANYHESTNRKLGSHLIYHGSSCWWRHDHVRSAAATVAHSKYWFQQMHVHYITRDYLNKWRSSNSNLQHVLFAPLNLCNLFE